MQSLSQWVSLRCRGVNPLAVYDSASRVAALTLSRADGPRSTGDCRGVKGIPERRRLFLETGTALVTSRLMFLNGVA